jgi:hypothetical protein
MTQEFEEPLGPVQAVARVNFALATIEVDLNPVAVVFDFMQPLVANRRGVPTPIGELSY